MIPGWLRPAFGTILVLLAVVTGVSAQSQLDWIAAGGLLVVGLANLLWPYFRQSRS
jgi:hypothetical protein